MTLPAASFTTRPAQQWAAPLVHALTLALAGLVLLAIAAFGWAPTSAAPAEPAAVSAVSPRAMDPQQLAAGLGCPITGDLVFSSEGTTAGNPAVVAEALCAGR